MRQFKKILLTLAVALTPTNISLAQELKQAERPIEELLAELADPETENWQKVQEDIIDIWSDSGSRSMDLLLKRGREAMDAENYKAALEHFTALTDHAPNFAEGWNMRATVFFVMERYGLSIEDVQRALALNPNHFSALAGLGFILERMGEEKSALKALRASQALHPHQERVNDAVKRLSQKHDGREI